MSDISYGIPIGRIGLYKGCARSLISKRAAGAVRDYRLSTVSESAAIRPALPIASATSSINTRRLLVADARSVRVWSIFKALLSHSPAWALIGPNPGRVVRWTGSAMSKNRIWLLSPWLSNTGEKQKSEPGEILCATIGNYSACPAL